MEGKRCSKCGESKPFTDFPRHTTTQDGRGSWCKACYNRYQRDRRKYDRQWARKCAARTKSRQREAAFLNRAFILTIASDGVMCCAECGCDDATKLVIDHIHENGREHRLQSGFKARSNRPEHAGYAAQSRYYGSMLKAGCDGLQILCRSCNTRKSNRNRKTKGA